MVLLEALACGKPVIATRCGGPEFIVTPENGKLVSKQDPSGLALAMLGMYAGSRDYDASLIRGQFLERFSKKIVMQQIESLYRDIVKNYKQARNRNEGNPLA